MDLFIKYEEDSVELPKFLCDSFDGMPPCSGYELISPVLTSLINEIESLRNEIKVIKDSELRQTLIIDDINAVKDDIIDVKTNVRDIKLKLYDQEIRRLSLANEVKSKIFFDELQSMQFNNDKSLDVSFESPPTPLRINENHTYTPTAPPLSQNDTSMKKLTQEENIKSKLYSEKVKSYYPATSQSDNNGINQRKKPKNQSLNFKIMFTPIKIKVNHGYITKIRSLERRK